MRCDNPPQNTVGKPFSHVYHHDELLLQVSVHESKRKVASQQHELVAQLV